MQNVQFDISGVRRRSEEEENDDNWLVSNKIQSSIWIKLTYICMSKIIVFDLMCFGMDVLQLCDLSNYILNSKVMS